MAYKTKNPCFVRINGIRNLCQVLVFRPQVYLSAMDLMATYTGNAVLEEGERHSLYLHLQKIIYLRSYEKFTASGNGIVVAVKTDSFILWI